MCRALRRTEVHAVKVIFLKDVLPTARAGDVKVVKDGFGRNYLLPQGLASIATEAQMKRSEGLRKAAQARRDKEAEGWRSLAAGIRGTPVTVMAKAGPNGRLFGSVTTQMVAAQISAATGKEIDRRGVRIASPIRQIGSYTVGLRLFEGVDTEVRIVVKPEGGSEAAAAAPEKEAPAAEMATEPTGAENGEQKA
jgi:large subunit ribosomal protein L9